MALRKPQHGTELEGTHDTPFMVEVFAKQASRQAGRQARKTSFPIEQSRFFQQHQRGAARRGAAAAKQDG